MKKISILLKNGLKRNKDNGKTFSELFAVQGVPIPLDSGYQKAWFKSMKARLYSSPDSAHLQRTVRNDDFHSNYFASLWESGHLSYFLKQTHLNLDVIMFSTIGKRSPKNIHCLLSRLFFWGNGGSSEKHRKTSRQKGRNRIQVLTLTVYIERFMAILSAILIAFVAKCFTSPLILSS